MAAPNKPGKDLSALKAKLSKKAAADAPPPEAAAPAGDSPAAVAPPAAMVADIPPPAGMEVPAPVAAPVAAPAPAAPAIDPDEPFTPGRAAAFDPNEGLLPDTGGGEIGGRSNVVAIAMAAAVAFLAGGAAGFLYSSASAAQKSVTSAKEWAAKQQPELKKVTGLRAELKTGYDKALETLGTDPAAAAAAFGELATKAAAIPSPDILFSAHLAKMPKDAVAATFNFYEEGNIVASRLLVMKKYLDLYGAGLKEEANRIQGNFVAVLDGKSVKLALVQGFACGESLEAAAPCEGEGGTPIGCIVVEELGGPPVTHPVDNCLVIQSNSIQGAIFAESPANYALANFDQARRDAVEHFDLMAKYEKQMIEGFEKYATGTVSNDGGGGGGGGAAAE